MLKKLTISFIWTLCIGLILFFTHRWIGNDAAAQEFLEKKYELTLHELKVTPSQSRLDLALNIQNTDLIISTTTSNEILIRYTQSNINKFSEVRYDIFRSELIIKKDYISIHPLDHFELKDFKEYIHIQIPVNISIRNLSLGMLGFCDVDFNSIYMENASINASTMYAEFRNFAFGSLDIESTFSSLSITNIFVDKKINFTMEYGIVSFEGRISADCEKIRFDVENAVFNLKLNEKHDVEHRLIYAFNAEKGMISLFYQNFFGNHTYNRKYYDGNVLGVVRLRIENSVVNIR